MTFEDTFGTDFDELFEEFVGVGFAKEIVRMSSMYLERFLRGSELDYCGILYRL